MNQYDWFIATHIVGLFPLWIVCVLYLPSVIYYLIGGVIMFVFWILHFIALLFFPLALFVTIPLHIIAGKKS